MQADYKGMQVSFTGDAWFNATAAARSFHKHLDDWLRLDDTKKYMHALASALNTADVRDLIRARRGRNGGTWLHPKLAVAFARWCDVGFAVWCDFHIDHILRGGMSILAKHGTDRSDTPDREPLLTAAAAIVARHRLPFTAVYEALNTFVGVAHARDMSCDQVFAASLFGRRLLSGTATAEDLATIERNRVALGIAPRQESLLGGA
jgi:hypothetical protein